MRYPPVFVVGCHFEPGYNAAPFGVTLAGTRFASVYDLRRIDRLACFVENERAGVFPAAGRPMAQYPGLLTDTKTANFQERQ